MTAWFESKYGSLNVTRFGPLWRDAEICAMWKSNGFSPGAKACVEDGVGDPVDLVGREAHRRGDGVGGCALEAFHASRARR